MDHGGSRSYRFSILPEDFAIEGGQGTLTWINEGAWTYALGDFGTIKALAGLSPWIARLRGSVIGLYTTLSEARIAVRS